MTELGFVSITVACSVGDRNPDHDENDALYALAEELDVPLGFHAGGPRFAYSRFVDQYAMLHTLEFPYDIMFAATTIVCGGVLERFPRLRLALLEAGSGWGPYIFERLDEHYEKRPGEMRITRQPSEFLADGRIVITCEAERWLPHSIAGLGPQTVAYASDYPHWDCEFPDSVTQDRGSRRPVRGRQGRAPRRQRPPRAGLDRMSRQRKSSSSTCRSASRRSR